MTAPTRAGHPEVPTREADAHDEIDGVRPRAVVSASTAEELASVLRTASDARRSMVIRGGGTKLGWGRTPKAIDLLLDTRSLNRVLAHRHGDLTLTVEAGAPLVNVQRVLAERRQWLPFDSAFEGATIGGLIATNDAGPLRHRYGTPRDLLLGVTLATTDGRLIHAGGQVVKNVAGYDLGKLMSGSFGSLAAIVSATFKLAPVPPPSVTLTAEFDTREALASAVVRVAGSQLEPLVFELHALGGRERRGGLLVRFASTPRAVAAQCADARRLLSPAAPETCEGTGEAEIWREQVAGPWEKPGAICRIGWRPAALPALLDVLDHAAADAGVAIELTGRAAVGAGLVRIEGDEATQARLVSRLRAGRPSIGAVTLLRANRALKERVDVWGDRPPAATALDAIKRAFDPAGVLNASRGPV